MSFFNQQHLCCSTSLIFQMSQWLFSSTISLSQTLIVAFSFLVLWCLWGEGFFLLYHRDGTLHYLFTSHVLMSQMRDNYIHPDGKNSIGWLKSFKKRLQGKRLLESLRNEEEMSSFQVKNMLQGFVGNCERACFR